MSVEVSVEGVLERAGGVVGNDGDGLLFGDDVPLSLAVDLTR